MDRREFLGAAAALTAAAAYGWGTPLPRRPYKNGIDLSIIAFGGIVVCGLPQEQASRRVAEAYDRGLNYFDCAPSYFDGGKIEDPFSRDASAEGLAANGTTTSQLGLQLEV